MGAEGRNVLTEPPCSLTCRWVTSRGHTAILYMWKLQFKGMELLTLNMGQTASEWPSQLGFELTSPNNRSSHLLSIYYALLFLFSR